MVAASALLALWAETHSFMVSAEGGGRLMYTGRLDALYCPDDFECSNSDCAAMWEEAVVALGQDKPRVSEEDFPSFVHQARCALRQVLSILL